MYIITLQLIFIIGGILLILFNFSFYAGKRMSENFGVMWVLLSILLVIIGFVKPVWQSVTMVNAFFLIPMMLIMMAFIFGFFFLTSSLSELKYKNQELAMQVSLLNEENANIIRKIKRLDHLNEENSTKQSETDNDME